MAARRRAVWPARLRASRGRRARPHNSRRQWGTTVRRSAITGEEDHRNLPFRCGDARAVDHEAAERRARRLGRRGPARSVDLTPTILNLAGAGSNARTDGESVTGLVRGTARRESPPSLLANWYPQLHFGWSRLRALRVGEWKYIPAPRPELYDLRTDADERRNVIGERSSVASRMAGELEAVERSFGEGATAAAPQPDAETIARLRSLGYIGLAAPPSGGTGADPKDRIGAMREFRALLTAANGNLKARRHDAALAKLKKAVALNERAYDAHVLLGSVWQEKGDLERAVGEFNAAAVLNPVMAAPHRTCGRRVPVSRSSAARDGARRQGGGARGGVRRVSSAAPGQILERAGRGTEALGEYQRAIAPSTPTDTASRGRLVGVAMNLARHDVAEPQLRILLKLNYQPARTHFALGKLAEARGDRASAAAEYTPRAGARARTDAGQTSAQRARRTVMNGRVVSLAALVCLCLVVAVGCGGGGGGGTPTTPTTPPPAGIPGGACGVLGSTASASIDILNGTDCPSGASAVVLLNMRDSFNSPGRRMLRNGDRAAGDPDGRPLHPVHCPFGANVSRQQYRGRGGSRSSRIPITAAALQTDVAIVIMPQPIGRTPESGTPDSRRPRRRIGGDRRLGTQPARHPVDVAGWRHDNQRGRHAARNPVQRQRQLRLFG